MSSGVSYPSTVLPRVLDRSAPQQPSHKTLGNMKEYLQGKTAITVLEEDCSLCQSKVKLKHMPVIIQRALATKYSNSINYFYTKGINEILQGTRSQSLVLYLEDEYWLPSRECIVSYFPGNKYQTMFGNLWKYHQFNIDQPKQPTKGIFSIAEGYFHSKRKLQEKAIKKMLEVMTDSELEQCEIHLSRFLNQPVEILETEYKAADQLIPTRLDSSSRVQGMNSLSMIESICQAGIRRDSVSRGNYLILECGDSPTPWESKVVLPQEQKMRTSPLRRGKLTLVDWPSFMNNSDIKDFEAILVKTPVAAAAVNGFSYKYPMKNCFRKKSRENQVKKVGPMEPTSHRERPANYSNKKSLILPSTSKLSNIKNSSSLARLHNDANIIKQAKVIKDATATQNKTRLNKTDGTKLLTKYSLVSTPQKVHNTQLQKIGQNLISKTVSALLASTKNKSGGSKSSKKNCSSDSTKKDKVKSLSRSKSNKKKVLSKTDVDKLNLLTETAQRQRAGMENVGPARSKKCIGIASPNQTVFPFPNQNPANLHHTQNFKKSILESLSSQTLYRSTGFKSAPSSEKQRINTDPSAHSVKRGSKAKTDLPSNLLISSALNNKSSQSKIDVRSGEVGNSGGALLTEYDKFNIYSNSFIHNIIVSRRSGNGEVGPSSPRTHRSPQMDSGRPTLHNKSSQASGSTTRQRSPAKKGYNTSPTGSPKINRKIKKMT